MTSLSITPNPLPQMFWVRRALSLARAVGVLLVQAVPVLVGAICTLALLWALPRVVAAEAGTTTGRPSRLEWRAWRPASCMPGGCFCEGVRESGMRQRVNTWSNLGFVLAGLAVAGVAGRDLFRGTCPGRTNRMRTHWVYPGVYGATAVLVGFASMFYHASLTFVGQTLDVLSMYLLTSFMALYSLLRLGWLDDGAFAAVYGVTNGSLGALAIAWPALRRWIFVGLAVAVLVSEIAVLIKRRPAKLGGIQMTVGYLVAALVCLAGAGAAWSLDLAGVGCVPGGWFQGHSVWHVLMATVILFLYLYYRSERAGRRSGAGASWI